MSRGLIITVTILLVAVLALGAYVLHLKRSAERQEARVTDARPITPPVAGAPAQVTLVLANDADGTLRGQATPVLLPQNAAEKPAAILRALIARYQEDGSSHPLGAGADINEVYVVNGNLAVIDVNAAFADGHRSGIMVEELTLASLAETVASNVPGVTHIKLLVDGKERPTLAGHADLSDTYDIGQAMRSIQLVK